MNNFAKVLFATAAVVAVVVVGINLLPGGRTGTGGLPPSPSMSPTVPHSPSMNPTPEPSPALVTHVLTPFGPGGSNDPDPRAASITFTIAAPATWDALGKAGVWITDNGPAAGMFFYRLPSGLYSDPCRPDSEGPDDDITKLADPDITVGPTVDDFLTALADHPSLDVTAPVEVTLGGYSGKYVDLLVPDDISECFRYRPMEVRHHYAQGPGQRWHMWILDIDGVPVLVETNDYPDTSAKRLAEEQAIVDSLEITP